ncbi:MAG: ABC transporter ATP-binding protein/permease [Bacteroidales bacterium]|nr:ABC transporter ATP-binding protein/permease [Bacteroidales bacterium]MCF8390178.1 ABC transporter ATP-binding protein/permease [Bacteroidales bacterium]
MNKIVRISKYLIPFKWNMISSILFMVLTAIFSISTLALIAPFLNLLFGQTELVTEQTDLKFGMESIIQYFNFKMSGIIIFKGKVYALIFVGLLVLITTLLKNFFFYFSKFFMIPARSGVVRDIRNQIYAKLLNLPLGYFSEERKGDIISRVGQDAQEIEVSIIRSLEMLLKDPILVIVYLSGLFFISMELSLFVLIFLPISGMIIAWVGKSLRSTSLKGQQKLGVIISHIEETLAGLRIIKAFNAEIKMTRRFESTNSLYTRLLVKLFRRQQLASPVSEFLGVMVIVVVLWFGGKMALEGTGSVTPSGLIAYLAIFSQIIQPAKAITTGYFSLQKGMASVDRIDEILDAEVTIKDKEDALSKSSFEKAVSYKNVSFKYKNDLVLKNINLEIPKGKTIAVVGRSGSGKSTLVDLLPRFIDVLEGEVLIDGINVKDLKLKDLRKLMGIVSQQSILFNDTFFNNIAFGLDNVDAKDVIAAAKVANAHEFIMETPLQYHTNIGEGGGKLSGGQRQRLSIARAVLKNPPILILDEATSALDTESELFVQEAIVKLMQNRTSIVIAHRLSTVKYADLIVVIDEGKIVEMGRHDELVKIKGGTYKKLHKLQMY